MYRATGILIISLLILAACRAEPQPGPTTTLTQAATADNQPTVATNPTTPLPTTPTAAPGAQIFVPVAPAGEGEQPTGTTAAAAYPEQPTPTATPAPPTPTPEPEYPIYTGPPLDQDEIGLQIYLHRQDVRDLLRHLEALDAGWVKVQVSWKLHEPQPGQYNEELFSELDRLVAGANGQDVNVLLSVSKAPEWSRPTTEMD